MHKGIPMSQTRQEQTSSSMAVMKGLIYGSAAGATEVLADHPFWTMKTRSQQGKPFTLNYRVLYQGLVPNMMSMMPITAAQFGVNAAFKSLVFGETMTPSQTMMAAVMAGVVAAGIAGPTERVMTYQKAGVSFTKTAAAMIKQGGYRTLAAGLAATAIRDGGFTAGIFAGADIVKAQIKDYCPGDRSATIAGSVGAGVVAALVTQAFDTMKTQQQSASPSEPVSMPAAFRKIHSKHGVSGFFKGTFARTARVASGVTIMNLVREEMQKRFG